MESELASACVVLPFGAGAIGIGHECGVDELVADIAYLSSHNALILSIGSFPDDGLTACWFDRLQEEFERRRVDVDIT